MKKTFSLSLFLVAPLAAVLITTDSALGQCSDAGVCSIGHSGGPVRHSLEAGYTFGRSTSEDDISYHSAGLKAILRVFDDSDIQISLPYSAQTGPLGTVQGVGDVIVLWAQRFQLRGSKNLEFHAGARLSTAGVNEGGLPQRYQSGLGTTDLLFGLSYGVGEWNAALGYQFSRGRSSNSVDRLKRGDDFLFRGGYQYEADRWSIAGEVLVIKRLHLSSVRDTTAAEAFVDIPGSDQLQINILARPSYQFSENLSLTAQLAIPLLDREINVDGLTRAFTISAGLTYTFSF